MKRKKIILLGICSLLAMTLTACSGESGSEIAVDKDGNPLPVAYEDITDGIYLCRPYSEDERLFYRLMYPSAGFSSAAGGAVGDYVWYSGYENAIPEFKKGDKIYLYSSSGIPDALTFWRLDDMGYTLGIRFDRSNSSKTVSFKDAEYCPYSIVERVVSSQFEETGMEDIRISEINGLQFSPSKLLTPQGFVRSLTKDEMYKFGYYQGTVWKEISIQADTRVLMYVNELTTRSYKEEKDKLFEVNLPSGMENGYWYLEGYGIFNYTAGESDLITNDAK